MIRPKDRASAQGLLPRMEARPRKDGLVTYRFHPINGKPINLGTDKSQAIRRVLDLTQSAPTVGTIKDLWTTYQDTPDWKLLSERTQADYKVYSVHLLSVFGEMLASDITAPMVARYLRVERSDAPVRGNREISLLGNLIGLAIERGEATVNPCRGGQVKRNKERPRTMSPDTADIQALVAYAQAKGGQAQIIAAAAEFSALAGNRQVEFLGMHWSQIGENEIRLMRAKQRAGVEKVEKIEISPAMRELLARLRALATNDLIGVVFRNRSGNAYTYDGFASGWQKLMREALDKGIVKRRFTFHDLRAYYVTQHKAMRQSLPDIHASPTTTARIYERSGEAKRKAL